MLLMLMFGGASAGTPVEPTEVSDNWLIRARRRKRRA